MPKSRALLALERQQLPPAPPDPVVVGLDDVLARLGSIVEQLAAVERSIPKPVDHSDKLKSLAGQIDRVGSQIEQIRFPEFPEIPQPEVVDLSPILKAMPKPAEGPPKQWVFKIKRSKDGFIQEVIADGN